MRSIEVIAGTKVQYLSHELLFLALSGQPYRGTVAIAFESIGESFNLLDFKVYLTSLRSQTFTAENIAHEIYQKIQSHIKTKDLGIIIDLSSRGGIQQRLAFGADFALVKKETIFQVG